MSLDLFATAGSEERLGPGTLLLRGYASEQAPALLAAIAEIVAAAPLRQMVTPGGLAMAVAMSNCGPLGWVSDRAGYRYQGSDPQSGLPWPPMPAAWQALAHEAAAHAGFADFAPDACLINRYAPGTRLSLHQDKDERDFSQPIVSVSLGLPAVFLFGGLRRADRAGRIALTHGDVLVWGGPDRLRYHGILPLKDGEHPLTGACRFNLTFRRAS